MFLGVLVAKGVVSRMHTINGKRVDVSLDPSIRETHSQETAADQVRLGRFMINLRPIHFRKSVWLRFMCLILYNYAKWSNPCMEEYHCT